MPVDHPGAEAASIACDGVEKAATTANAKMIPSAFMALSSTFLSAVAGLTPDVCLIPIVTPAPHMFTIFRIWKLGHGILNRARHDERICFELRLLNEANSS